MSHAGLDWKRLYPKWMHRKFWIERFHSMLAWLASRPAWLADLWTRGVAWFRGGGLRRIPLYLRNWATSAGRVVLDRIHRTLLWIGNLRVAVVFKWFVVTSVVVLVLVAAALYMVVRYPSTQIPEHDPVDQVYYLDQGWGTSASSEARQKFYYTPQGTTLFRMRYSWFTNIEEGWSRQRFARPENMRALGFLIDDTYSAANPAKLPIGFTKHYDTQANEEVLDITCAACHTGEIDVMTKDHGHVGIRIDGGPAMHAFTAMKVGHFAPTLLAAMGATLLNPFKFNRFAYTVLGEQSYQNGKASLYVEFFKVFWAMGKEGIIETRRHLYPVDEGFGRIDAMGRIANKVFGEELDPANYRVGNAPVSYPALWDIWKFDWVQYTAAVSQPMARNLVEAQGVGAVLTLKDDYGRPLAPSKRFDSSADVEGIHEIEQLLWSLSPPKWPEQLLGPINQDKANRGRELYGQFCAHCHEPCEMGAEDRAVLVPGKKPNQPQWRLNYVPVEDIGTDPAAALNFVNNRVDIAGTGITEPELRPLLKATYLEQQSRDNKYRQSVGLPPVNNECQIDQKLDSIDLKAVPVGAGLSFIGTFLRDKYYADNHFSKEQQEDYNGFGALDIPQIKLVYKPRPLAGVWATAPYLHNGSVPTLYEMLLPADRRRKKFFVGRREFDPVRVGLLPEPLSKNGFWLDTSIPGNLNIGHEFRAGYREWHPGDPPSHGIIGPELTDDQRWAIIEYLKVRSDDPAPPIKAGQQVCAPEPPPPPPVPCPAPPAAGARSGGAR